MFDSPDQIYITQRVGRGSYNIRLTRSVAEAVGGTPIAGEDELIAWAEVSMDEIIAAARRHRTRVNQERGKWQELEARDFEADHRPASDD